MTAQTMLARDTQKLRAWIAERLGTNEGSDYPATWAGIMSQRATRKDHKAAGVLLLLGPSPQKPDVISFHLIKRARVVSQGGDISCPGGMLDPPIDRLLKSLIHAYLLPTMVGAPRTYAQRRGKETFRLIELFFATGLRETWEEIGLLPWQVRFLGPLSTYTLSLFPRTIFPLVAWVANPRKMHPNKEVEKILHVPLTAFLSPATTPILPFPARRHLLIIESHPLLSSVTRKGQQRSSGELPSTLF